MDFRASIKRVKEWYDAAMFDYNEKYSKMGQLSERKAFYQDFKKKVQEISNEIDCINAEIEFIEDQSERTDVAIHVRIFEQNLKELEVLLLRIQQRDQNFQADAMKEMKERQKRLNELDVDNPESEGVKQFKQQTIAYGDELYAEAKTKIDNIKETIQQSQDRLRAINEEVRQQNYKLLEIDDLIKQSQSLFVRARELIRFFTKTFYKDKVMNLLIGLSAMMCVGCVVLIILEKKKKGSSATPATTPNNTTAARLLSIDTIWP